MSDRAESAEGGHHSVNGVGEETAVFCPHAGVTFGPGGKRSEFRHCPYCGEEADAGEHDPDVIDGEVMCRETPMSTYRYCPDCGEVVIGS